ncbi:uncharacterized protein LOC118152952 [Callithrix jacchus]
MVVPPGIVLGIMLANQSQNSVSDFQRAHKPVAKANACPTTPPSWLSLPSKSGYDEDDDGIVIRCSGSPEIGDNWRGVIRKVITSSPTLKQHTQSRSPRGAPKGGRGRSLGQPRPQANSYFHPAPACGRGNGAPIPALPRGRTPQGCPPVQPRDRERRLPGSPAERPGCQGTAAQGPAAGAAGTACAGAPAAGRLRSIPAASRGASRRLLTCAALRLQSPFTWSSPRPPPARLRRLRELPGGHGSRWAFREQRGGGAGVSPARRPDPSQALAAAAGRCGAGGGFVCARAVLGARGEARRAWAGEDALLAGQPCFCSGRWLAGGSRRPSARGDPSSSPAAAPSSPAPLLTDGASATTRRRHHRGCSLLLSLMLGPSSSGGERGGGGARPESGRPRCPIKEPLGSCGPQPLAPGAWAGRQWVGPQSGLSVTVAAGIPGCVRCRVCKRMRGWRRSSWFSTSSIVSCLQKRGSRLSI